MDDIAIRKLDKIAEMYDLGMLMEGDYALNQEATLHVQAVFAKGNQQFRLEIEELDAPYVPKLATEGKRRPPYKVKLNYHRLTGKWGSTSEYETEHHEIYDVVKEIRAMRLRQELPGLIKGHSEYHIVVDLSDHPKGWPQLILYDGRD